MPSPRDDGAPPTADAPGTGAPRTEQGPSTASASPRPHSGTAHAALPDLDLSNVDLSDLGLDIDPADVGRPSGDAAHHTDAAHGTGNPQAGSSGAAESAPGPGVAGSGPAGEVEEASPEAVPSLIDAFGGVRGMVDMTVPGVAFVVAFTIANKVALASIVALVIAAVLAASRLMRRETVQHALGGFLGVAICAFVAWKSGNAANFYLPRILLNGAYAAGCLLSNLVRWPFMGLALGPLFGENFTWRGRPGRLGAYTRMTWIWCALFVFRLLIEIPLYVWAGPTTLGVAAVALGVPPWLVAIYLSWLVLRKAPPPVRDPNALWGIAPRGSNERGRGDANRVTHKGEAETQPDS